MALPLTRPQQGIIAQTLTVALLVGGLQILCGVAIRDSQPAFTLDICHPAQVLVQASPILLLPSLPHRGLTGPSPLRAKLCDMCVPLKSRLDEAPDPPPPKSLS